MSRKSKKTSWSDRYALWAPRLSRAAKIGLPDEGAGFAAAMVQTIVGASEEHRPDAVSGGITRYLNVANIGERVVSPKLA